MTRRAPWFALLLVPLASFLSPACDSEEDCPAGHEGCVCAAEYSCLDGLQCLSEYCVDPNGGGGGSADPAGSGGGSGSTNNEAACQDFLDSIECGFPGGVAPIDCSIYSQVTCDITDYLNCLSDNAVCTNDMLDASGWMDCLSLAEDCT